MTGLIVGRKAIMKYLDCAWRTVVRWKKYGLPIINAPGGQPVIFPSEVEAWLKKYDELKKKKKSSPVL